MVMIDGRHEKTSNNFLFLAWSGIIQDGANKPPSGYPLHPVYDRGADRRTQRTVTGRFGGCHTRAHVIRYHRKIGRDRVEDVLRRFTVVPYIHTRKDTESRIGDYRRLKTSFKRVFRPYIRLMYIKSHVRKNNKRISVNIYSYQSMYKIYANVHKMKVNYSWNKIFDE